MIVNCKYNINFKIFSYYCLMSITNYSLHKYVKCVSSVIILVNK